MRWDAAFAKDLVNGPANWEFRKNFQKKQNVLI